MRKITLFSILLVTTLTVFGQTHQTPYQIVYTQWSDSAIFKQSPEPFVSGIGEYSDTLSHIYNEMTFYEYNGEYYCINSWADYYYWFTKKYSYYFENPLLYDYYYWSRNNLEMAKYIASYNYKGRFYPSFIKLDFKDKVNSIYKINNHKYIASNQSQIQKFKKQASKPKKVTSYTKYDKENKTYYSFNKTPSNISHNTHARTSKVSSSTSLKRSSSIKSKKTSTSSGSIKTSPKSNKGSITKK